MGLFDFFTRNAINDAMMAQQEEPTTFEATENRSNLKNQLALQLMQCGFTQLEVREVLDVITLAEADIKVAEDSLATYISASARVITSSTSRTSRWT